jgi:hypothetical protein
VRLDEFLLILVIIFSVAISVYSARKYGAKPHKLLIRLIAANIILDVIAIAIWGLIPSTQWSIYQLNFSIVGAEAGVAAALFAVTLFGLIRRKKWAPFLAIGLTITQRCFATYIFFPSTALVVTLIWSLMIIYFAYREIGTKIEDAANNKPL